MTQDTPVSEAGRLYVMPGDIARLSADAVACSSSDEGSLGATGSVLKHRHPALGDWRGFGGRVEIGTCDWVPLNRGAGGASGATGDAAPRPGGVVIVAATGGGKSASKDGERAADWKAEASGYNATWVAIERARVVFPNGSGPSKASEAGHKRRLLVALSLFRTGYAEAADVPLWAAKAQLSGMRRALDDWHAQHPADDGADAVLVCYTPEHYQTVARARREAGWAPRAQWTDGAGNTQSGVPEEILRAAREGHCVFFVGAGMSLDSGLPSWEELIGHLAREAGVAPEEARNYSNSTDFFLDVAQKYRDQRHHAAPKFTAGAGNANSARPCQGEVDELGRYIAGKFRTRRPARARRSEGQAAPSPAHFWLGALGLRHIVTTNYDDLLEEALEAQRRDPISIVDEGDVAQAQGAGTHVVKMHGDARRPECGIVLSRDDYDSFFDRRPAMAALLQGLMLNQTFVFLGYSLRDPNFRQVYHRIGAMLPDDQRTAYAATVGTVSALQTASWKRKKIEPLAFADTRALWDFLDALCADVSGSDRLFLSPEFDAEFNTAANASSAPEIHGLSEAREAHALPQEEEAEAYFARAREHLSAAGEAILEAAAAPEGLSEDEAAHAARVLEFLSACGWRPRHNGFNRRGRALENLAERVQDPGTRRALLLSALADARTDRDARRLRARRRELDEQSRQPDDPPDGS